MSDFYLNTATIKTLRHSTLAVIAADLEEQWKAIPRKFKFSDDSNDIADRIIRLLYRATQICDDELICAGYHKKLGNAYLTLEIRGKDDAWVTEMERAICKYISAQKYSYARDTAKEIIASGRDWPDQEIVVNGINAHMRPMLYDYC